MLEKAFESLYLNFRLQYCKKLFFNLDESGEGLSATEAYCVEAIYLLGNPTMKEFADFVGISAPNASYRVANLIKKGFIEKEVGERDRRESNLSVTEKFRQSYGLNDTFNQQIMRGIRNDFTPEEVSILEKMILRIIKNIP